MLLFGPKQCLMSYKTEEANSDKIAIRVAKNVVQHDIQTFEFSQLNSNSNLTNLANLNNMMNSLFLPGGLSI